MQVKISGMSMGLWMALPMDDGWVRWYWAGG